MCLSDGGHLLLWFLLLCSLSPAVARKVKALKNLQLKYMELEADFYKEVQVLEAKYLKKYQPHHEKRATIVSGDYQPTDQECFWKSDEEEATADGKATGILHMPLFVGTPLPYLRVCVLSCACSCLHALDKCSPVRVLACMCVWVLYLLFICCFLAAEKDQAAVKVSWMSGCQRFSHIVMCWS